MSDPEDPLAELALYIADEVGVVPDGIRRMGALGPEWVTAFTNLRRAVGGERPGGLDPGMQSLVFMVIATTCNHVEGAVAHGRHALSRGVPEASILQALSQVMLFAGTHTWARTGSVVVRELGLGENRQEST